MQWLTYYGGADETSRFIGATFPTLLSGRSDQRFKINKATSISLSPNFCGIQILGGNGLFCGKWNSMEGNQINLRAIIVETLMMAKQASLFPPESARYRASSEIFCSLSCQSVLSPNRTVPSSISIALSLLTMLFWSF